MQDVRSSNLSLIPKSGIVPKGPIVPAFSAAPFLREILEFRGLLDKDLMELAATSRLVKVQSGDYVTIEGDDDTPSGFIVVSGCLAMLKTSISGKELIVKLLQPTDIFGLLVLLAREHLPAQLSARALRTSEVLMVPVSELQHLLTRYPSIFEEFVGSLLNSLQSSYDLARGLAHDQVEVRIAAILCNLAVNFSRVRDANAPYVVCFTRQQLANLTGTTAETAIRVTRSMQREGYIDISSPGVIKILDLEGLLSLSEQ
jgi:CRP-like cAMP-binding protein